MKHSFLDKYSDRDSAVHRLDPRAKLVTVFLLVLAVNLARPDMWTVFVTGFIIIVSLTLTARLPLWHVFKSSLSIVPFVLLVAISLPFLRTGEPVALFHLARWDITVTREGLQALSGVLVKSWLSVLGMVLLLATTRISDLLAGMQRLRFPGILVTILAFMYRYIFVLYDEVLRMKLGRDSRSFGRMPASRKLKTTGSMIGTLFIRSFERSERVYNAMLARGFNGRCLTISHLRFTAADVLLPVLVSAALVLTFAASIK